MHVRNWSLRFLLAVGMGLAFSAYGINADDQKAGDEPAAESESADEEDEVDFPKLPKGAGEIDKEAPKKFTQTKSGLKYRVLRKPKEDAPKPKRTSTVTVNYRGWFDNGKDFDSSYKSGKPAEFRLDGGVIKGWTEGIQLIGKGGMIELEIPYKLGYDEEGYPPAIPPKSTLHFLVELLEVH